MRNDFAVFILTYGRADNVITYNVLRKAGYTGRVYLLVDDTDKQLPEYIKRYGDEVHVFSKQAAIDLTDSCDNFKDRRTVIYARNWCFEAAKKLGLKYFWQLDDDYDQIGWTWTNKKEWITAKRDLHHIEMVIDSCLKFLETTPCLTVAFAQNGDFIGGHLSQFVAKGTRGWFARKAMNTFFCSVEKPFKFVGRINEDVNVYTMMGRQGCLFISIPRLRIHQKQTQSNAGGMTDVYVDQGTYTKSFYSIMCAPSCVKIVAMGYINRRIHHQVQWRYAVPKIMREKHRKKT